MLGRWAAASLTVISGLRISRGWASYSSDGTCSSRSEEIFGAGRLICDAHAVQSRCICIVVSWSS
jgi:hypothetical protein